MTLRNIDHIKPSANRVVYLHVMKLFMASCCEAQKIIHNASKNYVFEGCVKVEDQDKTGMCVGIGKEKAKTEDMPTARIERAILACR
jgi:hypothetical protein